MLVVSAELISEQHCVTAVTYISYCNFAEKPGIGYSVA